MTKISVAYIDKGSGNAKFPNEVKGNSPIAATLSREKAECCRGETVCGGETSRRDSEKGLIVLGSRVPRRLGRSEVERTVAWLEDEPAALFPLPRAKVVTLFRFLCASDGRVRCWKSSRLGESFTYRIVEHALQEKDSKTLQRHKYSKQVLESEATRAVSRVHQGSKQPRQPHKH